MADFGTNSSPGDDVLVRLTTSRTLADEWALVLTSAGIACRLVERDDGFALFASAADAAAARAALAAFDAENAVPVGPTMPAPDLGPSPLGVIFCALLLAMFVVAGAGEAHAPSVWFAAGSASAELIMRGQWWRAVTALTLHADVFHLGSNIVASLLFVSAVGRWLGAGLGAAVILAAATGANLLVAISKRVAYVSIGASTATFAALGILVGLQLVRRLRHEALGYRAWLPLGAGLGLFAMIGVGGERTDIRAHIFGLGVGALVGAGVAAAQHGFGLRAPGRVAQVGLGLLATAAVAGAWMLALR